MYAEYTSLTNWTVDELHSSRPPPFIRDETPRPRAVLDTLTDPALLGLFTRGLLYTATTTLYTEVNS